MQKKKIILIGAGISGLAAAIRLQHQGFDVMVYEANSYPGGKLTEIRKNGYRFDGGPSLFTMPQFVEELFKTSGRETSAYFSYIKKEVVCNYFYEDGTRFTAFADKQAFANAASEVFNVETTEVLKYFKRSKRKYDLTASLFLEKSLHKLSTYLSADTIWAILKINTLDIRTTLHQVNKRSFRDPKLVQFFDRFATYNGSSPYLTPGIMSMIPHLEQYYGTFFPKGGMHSIAKSLYQLALDEGVKFNFDTSVDTIEVENNRVKGVSIMGKQVEADIVISNMDIVPTYRKLLKGRKAPEKILQQPRSSSALIFYWGIKDIFPELDLHNIFFSNDYQKEFECIFNKKEVYNDPTVYVHISSKNEPGDAPERCENWFVMINVPGNAKHQDGSLDWVEVTQRSKTNILSKLSRILKRDIEPLIQVEEILDPVKIEANTQSYQGSLYGSSSNNRYAAFLRHPNFSQNIRNLYFCGGSVHPGGGIPLCLLSAKIVSELIKKT